MAAADLIAHDARPTQSLADLWNGRRVLVTGHTGFIGSWLTTALLQLGARVTGFALADDAHARTRARALTELGADTRCGDVRDFAAVHQVMAAQPFDVVVHLAAQPVVSIGYSDPGMTLTTNVTGSVNVLEAARLCEPPVLVHVTSDKCYRNQDWPWPYREVDSLGGGCPYSVSKAAAELVFEAYASLYAAAGKRIRSSSVRFGNVIGGGDAAAGRLVPEVIAALRAGGPVVLRRPDAVRPWQHVLDVVHGLLLLSDGLADRSVSGGEVFNFAPPGDGETVHTLASALAASHRGLSGADVPLAEGRGDFPEDQLLRLDGRKAANALGWHHAFDCADAADSIVAWHHSVAGGSAPHEVTSAQVSHFLETIQQAPSARRQTGRHR
ncbi:CDP-glucose 4,6-dehydratase [Streptomyces sp. NPDC056004]|uniref:CDP-glucose 4,6-dehydratase n=1 Tax=Streptomyces sp. NPDC056004 TaxID=3345677 RepID=UPI0035E3B215